jgi:futalosine hydrolase
VNAPLLAHAAAVEGRGLGLPSLQIGVGKAEAAATIAAALAELRPRWVLLFGVCGAYPPGHVPGAGLEVGQLCVVGEEWFADEGVATADRFVSIADLGLGSIGPFHADAQRTEAAARVLGAPIVRAATVSTCSGTDETSQAAAARTGAAIETMEGAAVAVACRRAGVPWVQLRCVSNRTGERSRGGWDLPRAVAIVQEAVRTLAARGWDEST